MAPTFSLEKPSAGPDFFCLSALHEMDIQNIASGCKSSGRVFMIRPKVITMKRRLWARIMTRPNPDHHAEEPQQITRTVNLISEQLGKLLEMPFILSSSQIHLRFTRSSVAVKNSSHHGGVASNLQRDDRSSAFRR